MNQPTVTIGSKSRALLLRISFACWVLSLILPALLSDTPNHSLAGLHILLIGWLGVVGVQDSASLVGVLAWWANPLYLFAIHRSTFSNKVSSSLSYTSIALALLTFLVSNYATSEAPSYTDVIGYGPGAFLWILAMLILGYVASKDSNNTVLCSSTIGLAIILTIFFVTQLLWSATASNDSEREKLPYYAAKRGIVCSVTAPPSRIAERQRAIALRAEDSDHWLKALLQWGMNAVQIGETEYQKAPQGTPEAQKSPYLISHPVTAPARYLLHAQGGYPYINRWESGGDYVRLTLVDTKNNVELGAITYQREWKGNVGFCPSLTYFPYSQQEEAMRWLAPFMTAERMK